MKQILPAIATALAFFKQKNNKVIEPEPYLRQWLLTRGLLQPAKHISNASGFEMTDKRSGVVQTNDSAFCKEPPFRVYSASEQFGLQWTSLSKNIKRIGRSGEFCFLLRSKGSCHGLAKKAGRAELWPNTLHFENLNVTKRFANTLGFKMRDKRSGVVQTNDSAFCNELPLSFYSASEQFGLQWTSLSRIFHRIGRSGEFCFLLRSKGSCHGLAKKAGKAERNGNLNALGFAMNNRRWASAVNWHRNVLIHLVLTVVIICSSSVKSKSQELKIGDTIPQALWDLPLQAVQHPDGKQVFALKDYKDKLIILDFWATWCGPCVSSLAKLRDLQEEFIVDLAVIPITNQDAKTALQFLESKDNWLLTVVNENRLKSWFPYGSLPHQVWIKEGKVFAIPATEYTHSDNIAKVLLDVEVSMQMVGNASIAAEEPLFASPKNAPTIYYQSVLSGRLDTPISGGGFAPQTLNKVAFYNMTARALYQQAFGDAIQYDKKRIIWEAGDKLLREVTGYHLPKPLGDFEKDHFYNQWLEANTFCYQLYSKAALSEQECMSTMQQELNRYFASRYGIKATIEKRRIACLVLKDKGNANLLKSSDLAHPSLLLLKEKNHYQVQNIPFATAMPVILAQVNPNRLLVDSSRLSTNIDLLLPKTIDGNLALAKKELAKIGLSLNEEELLLDMLVIKKHQEELKSISHSKTK